MTGLDHLETAAREIAAGDIEVALGNLSEKLNLVRASAEPRAWRQFCRAARSHRLVERLAWDPIGEAAMRRPLDQDRLLDIVRAAPLACGAEDGAMRIHRYLALSNLAGALRERDEVIERQLCEASRATRHPSILTISSAAEVEGLPNSLDLALVRGLYDGLSTSAAMRLTRLVARRLRPGGVFLFSSLAEGASDNAFVEVAFNLRPVWRAAGEMRAIATAAGSGLARRHFESRNGAIHFCELLRP